jgi:hypothetical protein
MSSGCKSHDGDGHAATPAMGILERPRYSHGLILNDADLTSAVDYTRTLNRLLFSSLFGCGVICGLEVTVKVDCDLVVTVNPGLALDGCGDPIHLVGQAQVKLPRRDVLVDCGAKDPPNRQDFWVIACNKEKYCAPRTLICDGDELDCTSQPTRIRSGVVISVSFEPPHCGCSCGTFAGKPNTSRLAEMAQQLRSAQQDRSTDAKWTDDLQSYSERCHRAHYTDPACPPDCGCGTACSCGCCVLLGWVHWFRDEPEPHWVPLHHGVRRFVRPVLMADPRWDYRPVEAASIGAATSQQPASERKRQVKRAAVVAAAPGGTRG